MTSHRFYCVLDNAQRYRTYVLALVQGEQEEIQYYTLKEGETLLEADPPSMNLVKPKWNGTSWEESATPEEILEWEEAHPKPPVSTAPTLEERVADLEEALVTAVYGGEGV